MQTIQQRVKAARERLGLSKSAFAKRLLYDRNYVSDIEKGKRDPGARFVFQLEMVEREIESGLVSDARREKVSVEHEVLMSPAMDADEVAATPRAFLKQLREQTGLSQAELARKIGVDLKVIQGVEDGSRSISEQMADKLASTLRANKEKLLSGSDTPRIMDESGRTGTYGATPDVRLSKGKQARYVPRLSWAQAGALNSGYVDDSYEHEGVISIDINDRRAFGLRIRGDSMIPEIHEGDDAIVCPSWPPRNGRPVIVRTISGDVMCKIYQSKEGGQRIILSSYNPAHPPIELAREEIAWIYPVAQIVRSYR